MLSYGQNSRAHSPGLYSVSCLLSVVVAVSLFAQTKAGDRRILGLAHVAFRVSDVGKTTAFYEKSLGFAVPFSLPEEKAQDALTIIKVNDEQYIELLQDDVRSQGQLDHFALYTDDVAAMRDYLSAHGVPIVRDIHQGRVGNPFLAIRDPDGHPLEIVQYFPTSLTGQSKGKFMPADRISNRISQVGILIRSVGSAMKFYRDLLGFQEVSRSGGDSDHPDWIDLQAPNGSDIIELIPFTGMPSAADLKAKNHFSLVSSDVRRAVATLEKRTAASSVSHITVLTRDGLPPRAELFDPDGARIEIIETLSADKSTAQAPIRNR
jgi:catechol 2,3-dioxygenase-like lactoylglutathione lyase family enzyme